MNMMTTGTWNEDYDDDELSNDMMKKMTLDLSFCLLFLSNK